MLVFEIYTCEQQTLFWTLEYRENQHFKTTEQQSKHPKDGHVYSNLYTYILFRHKN